MRRKIEYINEYIIFKNVSLAVYILLNGNTCIERNIHSPNGSQDNVTYIRPSPPTSWHPTQETAQLPDLLLKKHLSLGFPPNRPLIYTLLYALHF